MPKLNALSQPALTNLATAPHGAESPSDRRDRVPVEAPRLKPPAHVSEHYGPDRFETMPRFDPMRLPPPGRGSLPDHDGSHPDETPRWMGPVTGALPLRPLIAVY